MSVEKRLDSTKCLIGTSSPTSGNEELFLAGGANGKKTKRYVKKKGQVRKRNSGDGVPQRFVDSNSSSSMISGKTSRDAAETMDKISETLKEMVIEGEVENPELQAANEKESETKKGAGLKKLRNEKNGEKIKAKNVKKVARKLASGDDVKNGESKAGKKLPKKKDDNEPKKGSKKDTKNDGNDKSRREVKMSGKKSPIELANVKSEEINRPNNNVCAVVKTEDPERPNKLLAVDKRKMEEQRKRDRETARFTKTVAKFSMKFMEAAKELGIVKPNEDSTSLSDTSGSSWTDSSSSSSCSCSACCDSGSSYCSCSDCCSRNSSTSFSSCDSSSLSSSETP